MDDLTQARETNRRLNRRLGELEGPLTSLVSHAQRECSEALIRAAHAQESQKATMRMWSTSFEARHANERLIGWLILALTVAVSWALISTAVAVWRW